MPHRSGLDDAPPDQEFELILGNKQLLSVVFLVCVLLGACFALGYVMGRNSATAAAATAGTVTAPATAADALPVQRPSITTAAPAGVNESSRKPDAQPAAAPPGDTAAAPAAPQETGPPAVLMPNPGETYLQVVAVGKKEAEVVLDVLRNKGFQAIISPVPNSGTLYRVLVGPGRDDEHLGVLRTNLEKAGFKPIPRKF